MITYSDVERLLAVSADEPSVLSVYLRVPADPAELRELPARADELLAAAAGGVRGVRADDEQQVRKLIEVHGRDWLGHTAAIFVASRAGLSEAFALPCELPDRAVLAARPHVRPLLVALQRCPSHLVAVVDRRHAWLFRVTGDRIERTASLAEAAQVRSPGFGGWYGLDSHRVNDLVIELAHEHFLDTIVLLERVLRPGEHEPLIVGGHKDTIAQFAGMLPTGLRERLSGSFVVDPHTMTPARVHHLAKPIIDAWVTEHERRLDIRLRQGEGLPAQGALTVAGIRPCLDAVNQRAVQLLVVPVGGMIGGFVCRKCRTLSVTGTDCQHGKAVSAPVPDLIEEMVTRTIDDGGRVEAVLDPPGDVAARLRFPLAQAHGR